MAQRLTEEFYGHDSLDVTYEFYFFRSTRYRANSFSASARSPKLSRSANAALTRASALRSESSIPNNAWYVGLCEAVSLPAVLPSCSEVWVTSRTSSTI